MTQLVGEAVSASLTPGPVIDAQGPIGQAQLVGVRAGRNKDFDRLVLDFEEPVPGNLVQYVRHLLQDGSGNPVPLRGGVAVDGIVGPITRAAMVRAQGL
ncbi:AMIN-like domain-containing (lipo)protein [Modestobacter excelsi]|uniref:AMIN-like domain-containing (lipo)protein n=1 Tax=Modestobacter excelsi TaxID=2213161 RepID=UPI001C20E14B|nr:hypothetical protein [Modestobacter excelsi]